MQTCLEKILTLPMQPAVTRISSSNIESTKKRISSSVNSPPSLFFSIKYEKDGEVFLELNALAIVYDPVLYWGEMKGQMLI